MPTLPTPTRTTNAVMSLPVVLVLLVGAALAGAAPTPQDATTNTIVTDSMTEDDGESFVASLILAVAHDWDDGRQIATQFLRAVPAATVNGTTFGPTNHPITEPGPLSFSAPPSTR